MPFQANEILSSFDVRLRQYATNQLKKVSYISKRASILFVEHVSADFKLLNIIKKETKDKLNPAIHLKKCSLLL